MSKAEERALEKYPIEMYKEVGWRCIDKNADKRKYFIEGYQQAEKNLELTWEDIREIYSIQYIVLNEYNDYDEPSSSTLYQEVLKRFKERKDK